MDSGSKEDRRIEVIVKGRSCYIIRRMAKKEKKDIKMEVKPEEV